MIGASGNGQGGRGGRGGRGRGGRGGAGGGFGGVGRGGNPNKRAMKEESKQQPGSFTRSRPFAKDEFDHEFLAICIMYLHLRLS